MPLSVALIVTVESVIVKSPLLTSVSSSTWIPSSVAVILTVAFLMVTAVVALMPSLASEVKSSVTESIVTLSALMACFSVLERVRVLPVPLVIVKAPAASMAFADVEEIELSERTFTVNSAEELEVIDESVKVTPSK